MLNVYNSLSRRKEPFKSLHANKIKMYVCGMTVYDRCHLGHARSMVCFDVIIRFFKSQGYDVTFVRNITDIDDKIIVRAQERGIPIHQLTAHYIEQMHQDMAALHLLPPDIEPRATEHIEHIIKFIQRLIDKGHAYVGGNGDVYYEVSTFDDYGKLSHKKLDGLLVGARVEVVEDKRSPLDFVLWKKAKPQEPHWSSPWGEGRPGWHIECSAMAMDKLGEQFDIHAGGLDLQFPHHENEIAQTEALTKKAFANYWVHSGMLQVNNEKMSKSLGNFFILSDLLKVHHPEVLRYFLMSSHYRSILNYSDEQLEVAKSSLMRLYQTLKGVSLLSEDAINVNNSAYHQRFIEAMNDDFNTPVALSVLFDLSREVNKTYSSELATLLKMLGGTLGLLQSSPDEFMRSGLNEKQRAAIDELIASRVIARQQRDWAKADEIRDELTAQGVKLEDGPDGTTWRVVT